MISVILYGRNDSYGYNLHKRGAISFNCIAEVLTHPDDEIIFVDTNTPDDLPTFPEAVRDTLTPRAKKLLRVLRVRPASYERFKNGTRMKVLEPLCRNVGIRRCNPKNRWILNSNTDMVFVPVRPGQSLSEAVADLPDGLYELPRFEMPEMLWESVDRANPQSIMEQFKLWGTRLHLNEVVRGNPENVFDGPGDFQLAPRQQLFAIQGMNEQMVLGWHVDSNLCRRLFLLNGKTHSFLERYHAYHCDHTRVNTMMHTAEGGTANDWRKFVNEVTSPYLPVQAETWGMPHEPVEEIRLTDAQANRYRDVLSGLLPGLEQPMLQSALLGESFNHGLLYDNLHALPYITDHLTQIPPTADVGYVGSNAECLRLIAAFRQGFGHTGRLLYDPEAMEAGQALEARSPKSEVRKDSALASDASAFEPRPSFGLRTSDFGLPATCVPTEASALYEKAFVFCLDLWMGNFETKTNPAGYAVPKPSPQAGRFAGLMMQRLQDFARREKARYDQSPAQTRKFLFFGTQNTWFENAASQLISIILTPYSSYVRHGMVRKDAFTKPFQPVCGHHLLVGDRAADFAAWVEREAGHPVRLFDFESAQVRAEALMQGTLEGQSAADTREALARNPAGTAVLKLRAAMAETDGQLAEAERLREILAEMSNRPLIITPLQRGDRADKGSFNRFSGLSTTETNAPRKTAEAVESVIVRPATPLKRGVNENTTIGIDARTLFYPDSAARGIGHYTQYHLRHLARCRPDWQFVLYANSATPTPPVASLLELPNVRLKLFSDYHAGEVDLLHVPDPLCLKPDFVSPLNLIPDVKTTATFHDLAGLRLYLGAYKPPQRLEYIERLEQLLQPRVRLLTVSEFTRRDLIHATGLPLENSIAIHAGLNRTNEPREAFGVRGIPPLSNVPPHTTAGECPALQTLRAGRSGPRCTAAPGETPAPLLTSEFIRQVRAKYGINQRFLLHVGALDPHKNFEAVVNVLGQLKDRDVQLVVVGEKDHYLKQVAEFAAGMKMHRIIFPGFLPRAELEALYHDAVALVFLSLYEGFGFPVLEAMAQGCPVITSNVTSLPEVTGGAAMLFAPNDVKGVSLAVEQLLNSRPLRTMLAEKGRARAAQFTWEKTARKTIAVWQEMLLDCASPLALSQGLGLRQSSGAFERATPSESARGRAQSKARPKIPLIWFAPWQNPSGYCSEALAFARGLAGAIPLRAVDAARTKSTAFLEGLPTETKQLVRSLLTEKVDLAGKIALQHVPGSAFAPTFSAAYDIGRTMFETDRLPEAWVKNCNLLDEIWVPSHFNLETFAASGVERDKLVVMPQAVDETLFNPEGCEPLPLPNRARFNFLSIFEWSTRKAWDVLLAAYLREFSAEDDVCLYLRTYLVNQPDADPRAVLEPIIRQFAASLNLGDKALPRIEILGGQIPTRDLPRLYRAAECLVAPSRGEGWGRPQHEAMMMGLPVIATNWSGNTEFMNEENSYLLDYELAAVENVEPAFAHYRGHHWANPSLAHLRKLMRFVQQNPEAARAKGCQAREQMLANFSLKPVANLVLKRLAEIEARLKNPACPAVTARCLKPAPITGPRKLNVSWEGSFSDLGSLSHVNRELTAALARVSGHQLLTICSSRRKEARSEKSEIRNPKSETPTVTVRHEWPPRWEPPASGPWVLIQPWEYGALPAEWVTRLEAVNEVWVPSEYVRRIFVDSGVAPAKVKLVPNGIDPAKFHPGTAPMNLPTKKSFKFLFVGGTIHRKGPDVLLEAFLNSFTASDDVCLVIKDFGGQSVYAGQTFEAQIRTARARPGAPEIIHLKDDLTPETMPGLYTACNCLVHPYRGEGFGLPVLEAMACGLPVVVTGGGATDDFADDAHAYRVPAVRKHFGSSVSGLKLVRAGWLLEPDRAALAERMKWVVTHQIEARAKGRQAGDFVRINWTWENAARIADGHLQRLASSHAPRTTHHAPHITHHASRITLPPCALLGHLAPARDLLRAGKLPEAWTATQAALKVRPFHPEAWLLLAEIAQAAGDSNSARRCAQHARQLAPGWKPAKQFLKSKFTGASKPTWLTLPDTLTHDAPRNTHHATRATDPTSRSTRSAPRLSVCLITKNEDQFLPRCLASIRALADQIIVVDTGSTDRTVEIAREHGAEVHPFTWCDDFSAARNTALEHATGDWILVLDADEELPRESHEPLRQLLRNPAVMAWRLPIIDVGREDEGRSFVPRLFRNAPALFYVGRVHEQVFTSLEVRRQEWGLDNRLGDAAISHHGYRPEVIASRGKIERNLRLLEKAVQELPGEPNLLMNYGLELTRSGQPDAGLDHYRKAFEIMSAQPASVIVPETREMLLAQFSTQLMAAKRFDEIVRVLTSLLAKAGGLTASLHFSLGLAYLERKQFTAAAAELRQCIAKRNQPSLAPFNKEILKAGPRHCLALCLERLGQTDPATQAFREALQDDPQSVPARLDFARFLAAHEQPVEALNLLFALAGEKPEETSVWLLGGQIALSRPDFLEVARDWTAQAEAHVPHDRAVLQQRAEALILSGRCEAALRVWRLLPAAGNPTIAAALILCETIRDENQFSPALQSEATVSREFLKWYQRLIQFGQRPAIEALNARLPQLEMVLPSAARMLTAVVTEALALEPVEAREPACAQ